MTEHELTHERCSELLADFAAGRLGAPETARVEAHLRGCPDCSDELRSVMALRAGDEQLADFERAALRRNVVAALDEDEPLTARERARLHRDVPAAAGEVIAAREPSRWRARAAAALGAAALLAVFGVAIVSLTGGEGDSETAAGLSDDVREKMGNGGGAEAGGHDEAAADQAAAPRPVPTYDSDAGRLSGKKLRNLGERGATLRAFASLSAADATELRDRYIADLADQAGTPVDSLILSCAEEVYEAQPYAALPAYAARGKLEGREALVLGFAWTDEDSGPLDQFMLWTWPQSSCDRPIDYRAGKIAPRK